MGANSLRSRIQAFEAAMEDEMPTTFNHRAILPGLNRQGNGNFTTNTTTTITNSRGQVIVVKGNGPIDYRQMMAMFQDGMNEDIDNRMG